MSAVPPPASPVERPDRSRGQPASSPQTQSELLTPGSPRVSRHDCQGLTRLQLDFRSSPWCALHTHSRSSLRPSRRRQGTIPRPHPVMSYRATRQISVSKCHRAVGITARTLPCRRHRCRRRPGTLRQVKGHCLRALPSTAPAATLRRSGGDVRETRAEATMHQQIAGWSSPRRRISERRARLGFPAASVLTGTEAERHHYERNKHQTAPGLTLDGGGMGVRRRNTKTRHGGAKHRRALLSWHGRWRLSCNTSPAPPLTLPFQALLAVSAIFGGLCWQLGAARSGGVE